MIVFSLSRTKSEENRLFPDELAHYFGETVWVIPSIYDLQPSGESIKIIREREEPMLLLSDLPLRAVRCLLRQSKVDLDSPSLLIFDYTDTKANQLREKISPTWQICTNERGTIEKNESDVSKDSSEKKPSLSGCVHIVPESALHRWYPIIDPDRCTGCLECVNFCLFGVYTISESERPHVEQPGACRNGCPACSRVCPSGAIMFPLYEDPYIAGYSDRILDNVGIEQNAESAKTAKNDELDDLIDQIDQF
ncbi:MAG: 4Fe-4S binding protein [Thermoguttaceae bacterium]